MTGIDVVVVVFGLAIVLFKVADVGAVVEVVLVEGNKIVALATGMDVVGVDVLVVVVDIQVVIFVVVVAVVNVATLHVIGTLLIVPVFTVETVTPIALTLGVLTVSRGSVK